MHNTSLMRGTQVSPYYSARTLTTLAGVAQYLKATTWHRTRPITNASILMTNGTVDAGSWRFHIGGNSDCFNNIVIDMVFVQRPFDWDKKAHRVWEGFMSVASFSCIETSGLVIIGLESPTRMRPALGGPNGLERYCIYYTDSRILC